MELGTLILINIILLILCTIIMLVVDHNDSNVWVFFVMIGLVIHFAIFLGVSDESTHRIPLKFHERFHNKVIYIDSSNRTYSSDKIEFLHDSIQVCYEFKTIEYLGLVDTTNESLTICSPNDTFKVDKEL